ncbi:MAG: hypothetical protein ACLQAT_14630 [Candidatus Binataceae bacterium]
MSAADDIIAALDFDFSGIFPEVSGILGKVADDRAGNRGCWW